MIVFAELAADMEGQSKKIDTVIVGMGNTGLSCARYLAKQGVEFAMLDTREQPPMADTISREFPGILLSPGGLDEELILSARRIIVSPGISSNLPLFQKAKADGCVVVGDIELFCEVSGAPVIAITGSNGKSTVTSLLAEMAKADGRKCAVGANLGTPALDLLSEGKVDHYILELSSFQLETVSRLNAVAAVVLNISDDHMDRYNTLAEYAAAKARIFNGNGVMVLNGDDPQVMNMQREGREMYTFSAAEPDDHNYGLRTYDDEVWLVRGQEKIIRRNEIKLIGDHNIANVLAAIALADVMNISRSAMFRVLMYFTGLPHRCQWVAENDGVNWYNDSKGTNVGAAIAAIKGLGNRGRIILIAGGEGKGADFTPLADVAREYLSAAVLIGRDAAKIRNVLTGIIPLVDATDMSAAVHAAAMLAKVGDDVLLSPACASLDMFENYQDRGDAFVEAVKKLVAGK